MVLEEVVRLTSSQATPSEASTASGSARESATNEAAHSDSVNPASASHSSTEAAPVNPPDLLDLPDEVIWSPSPVENASSRSVSPSPLCTCLACLTSIGKPEDDAYIVAGSDCGSMFIWDRYTTNTVRILEADSSTVNCVQPHPSICLLASSGIDSVVRLWSPRPEDDLEDSRVIKDHVGAAERNQRRSVTDPLELVLLNMGYRISGLDAGFTRRRPRRPRIVHRGERRGSGPRETRARRRSRHQSKSPSDEDGDFEVRIEWDMNEMDHDGEEDNDVQESAVPADGAGDEDYDNPDDLDDQPEARGATVYTGEPDPAITPEANGVTQQQETSSVDMTRVARPLDNRRGSRRGRRNRCQAGSSRLSVTVTTSSPCDSENPSSSAKPKTKRARNELTSSAFQPPIACSVFDDDEDDESAEEDVGSTDSDNPSRVGSTSFVRRTESSSHRSTRSGRGAGSSHHQPTVTPLATLRSVLHTGDHLFLFGAAPSTDGRPRQRERRSTTNSGSRMEEADDEENGVSEVPCS
ncbi:unnamed protein product [Echinostoma caproni]|uniref:WD_REPEATS_REGION domain-containing protein n=1 Tax=Echinostoma caproni TaxID=27848 RepID=A0A182ZZH8_9TREM|nr:unnamed protein product [Echinostoma caproni]